MARTIADTEIEERSMEMGLVAEQFETWPVGWSGVFVGALSAIALGLILGLVGVAVGAYHLNERIVQWSDFGFWTMVYAVLSAFFAFVVGGWTAVKIAGFRRAERGSLHGAIVWLVAVPILLVLMALGAGVFFGSWYAGLAGTPVWATPGEAMSDLDAPLVARNSAMGAVTALVLGLAGSVLGGWMGSGESMTLARRRVKGKYQHAA